jgi:hypothetical protein
MKRIRIVGLCLMAVFALSAAAAGSASAELWPLWEPRSGLHFPIHYTGLLTATTTLGTANTEVKCTSVHYLGLILNPHLADTHYLFLHCTTEVLKTVITCTGVGLASEQILIEVDEHLGLIDDPSTHLFNNVGVLVLLPAGFHFTCGTGLLETEIQVSGSVISQSLSPVNKQSHEFEFLYKPIKRGEPLWTLFLSPLIGTVHALLLTKLISNGSSGPNETSSQESEKPGKILFLPSEETVELKL